MDSSRDLDRPAGALLALALFLALPALVAEEAAVEDAAATMADLGARTRTPKQGEVRSYGLKVKVRAQGQMVETVAEGGPAAKAGLRKGDAITRLAGVRIYSSDVLRDLLRVTPPGTTVEAEIIRKGKSGKYGKSTVEIELGKGSPMPEGIDWRFASLEQLEAAKAVAAKEEKLILVGLSGAET